MSLVLTEVSYYGVAMAADSAVTYDTGRVLVGFQKLLPVPPINAGLAIWGNSNIDNEDADIWLQRYIESEITPQMSLWDMSNNLAANLNEIFGGPIDKRMGIHVGGFDTKDGVRGPAFYHIHNGHYHVDLRDGSEIDVPEESPRIREFRAHMDRPPAVYGQNSIPQITRNGDFGIFAFLSENLQRTLSNIQQMTGLRFPFPETLASRGEYLRFWINLAKEIYRLSNFKTRVLPEPVMMGDAHIGGPVSVLIISEAGIQDFYSK